MILELHTYDSIDFRGQLKVKARDIVETYYADVLKPSITDNINSNQYQEVVADNVKMLLGDTTFLLAPELDDQVRHFYISF